MFQKSLIQHIFQIDKMITNDSYCIAPSQEISPPVKKDHRKLILIFIRVLIQNNNNTKVENSHSEGVYFLLIMV